VRLQILWKTLVSTFCFLILLGQFSHWAWKN